MSQDSALNSTEPPRSGLSSVSSLTERLKAKIKDDAQVIESQTQAEQQQLANAFERNIAAHPADWHMLQPLWEADWSASRRERILGAGDGAGGA